LVRAAVIGPKDVGAPIAVEVGDEDVMRAPLGHLDLLPAGIEIPDDRPVLSSDGNIELAIAIKIAGQLRPRIARWLFIHDSALKIECRLTHQRPPLDRGNHAASR
jgi:hypothetical protein